MAYFLGRDVAVIITTESITDGEQIGVNGTQSGLCTAGASLDLVFAKEMENADTDGFTQVSDLTGVDVSIGATDEDITYIGQKATGKVEIKKEMTVSLTRKKKNNLWDVIFNGPTFSGSLTSAPSANSFQGARWGLDGSGSKIGTGLVNPKDVVDTGLTTVVEFGYRLCVVLNASATAGEVMCFPNCTINSYSTSLNADGTTEETMEFGTQQPVVYAANGTKINNTQTLKVNF
jgi:hypothetical protein